MPVGLRRTAEEYKTRNLMKTEIKSADVGALVSAMAGKLFGKTTGAQIPMDGGNDRVIWKPANARELTRMGWRQITA